MATATLPQTNSYKNAADGRTNGGVNAVPSVLVQQNDQLHLN